MEVGERLYPALGHATVAADGSFAVVAERPGGLISNATDVRAASPDDPLADRAQYRTEPFQRRCDRCTLAAPDHPERPPVI